jgi:antitoxin component YwqK of YwqJK toxin-antitoxin module
MLAQCSFLFLSSSSVFQLGSGSGRKIFKFPNIAKPYRWLLYMKFTFISIQIFLPLLLFGQTISVDTDYYLSGKIHWKGNMLQVDNSSSPIGLWEYWHENGIKKLETWDDSSSKTFYLNMWLPNGEQILKNGQGLLYEIWPLGGNEWDSSVYQIKDSIKQGFYRGYRLYPKNKYFQVFTGQYDINSKKTGEWIFKDTVVYKNWLIEYYLDDKLNGRSQHLFSNGIIKDSGQYKYDSQEGEWRYYYSNGKLFKVCNYKEGNLINDYQEFYKNQKIKIQGQYIQDIGYNTIHSVSIGRRSSTKNKTRTRVKSQLVKNKSYKEGVWKYFNADGKLIKIITYKKGEIVKL